jgi:hypothetical protein
MSQSRQLHRLSKRENHPTSNLPTTDSSDAGADWECYCSRSALGVRHSGHEHSTAVTSIYLRYIWPSTQLGQLVPGESLAVSSRRTETASFVSTVFHKDPCSDRRYLHCISPRSRKSSARSGSIMHSSPTTRNYTSRSRKTTKQQGYQNALVQFNSGLISMVCLRIQTKLKPLLSALANENGWKV